MNNNVPIQARPEFKESPILPATLDLPLWVTGLAFWTLIVLATAMAVFSAEPSRTQPAMGTAEINRVGDVISWDAERATGRGKRAMLHSDLFSIVPAAKRPAAREMFVRAVEGPPYVFHEVHWYEAGAAYSVKFKRVGGGVYLATITRSK